MIMRCGKTTRQAMNNVNCNIIKTKPYFHNQLRFVYKKDDLYYGLRSYQKRESQEAPYRPQSKGEPAFADSSHNNKYDILPVVPDD